jgi:hypothetical protein
MENVSQQQNTAIKATMTRTVGRRSSLRIRPRPRFGGPASGRLAGGS